MNFNRFLSIPVETFAAQFQRDGRLLLFQHISKTAGSSLARELAISLPPYVNVHIGHDAYRIDGMQFDAMTAAVEAFLVADPVRRFRSASGHLRAGHLRLVREALPHASVFTVLRDPVARIVSEYRYSSTPKHPPHARFVAEFPTIEAFVESPKHQDKMWMWLGGRDPGEEEMSRIFNRYLFIGLVEDLSLHFEFLTGLMGCPKVIATRTNVTEGTESNRIEVTDALRARIIALNPRDVALYDGVKARLDPKRSEMADYVARRRADFMGLHAGS